PRWPVHRAVPSWTRRSTSSTDPQRLLDTPTGGDKPALQATSAADAPKGSAAEVIELPQRPSNGPRRNRTCDPLIERGEPRASHERAASAPTLRRRESLRFSMVTRAQADHSPVRERFGARSRASRRRAELLDG